MDAREQISWMDCPTCGGLVAVSWRDGDPIAVDCAAGCLLRVDRVPLLAGGRHRAGRPDDAEQMASILEDAVLETTEAYGLSDPRVAAALVADAWVDILREEGRSTRLVGQATAAVREVGDQLHRRQCATGSLDVGDSLTDIRVLVVDDHPLARLRLIEMLAGEADLSIVGVCGSGPQAVEAAAQLRPHVVCMDRYMPVADGLAASRALRAAEPDVRIILLDGGPAAPREDALAGADALVPEGAGRDALLRCLRTVARRGTDCPYCL